MRLIICSTSCPFQSLQPWLYYLSLSLEIFSPDRKVTIQIQGHGLSLPSQPCSETQRTTLANNESLTLLQHYLCGRTARFYLFTAKVVFVRIRLMWLCLSKSRRKSGISLMQSYRPLRFRMSARALTGRESRGEREGRAASDSQRRPTAPSLTLDATHVISQEL